MKIVILSDHYPISPRINKVRNSLLKSYKNANVIVLSWNRENKEIKEDYVLGFNQEIGYGNRLSKLLNSIKYYLFVRKSINKIEPTYIHAIDIESLIIAALLKKNYKIIYEIYDIKFFNNKAINFIREKLEFFTINRKVHALIYASPFFDMYYKMNVRSSIPRIVLNNKPSFEVQSQNKSGYLKEYSHVLEGKFVIGFIGTIRYREIIMNLIKTVKNDLSNTMILLAGYGPESFSIKTFIEENNLNDKVLMTGRYENSDIREIYEACDLIWAAYPNKDLNVKYAISNKFFEAQIFNKPIIVSESTFLANEVEKSSLGFVVNPYDYVNISEVVQKAKRYNSISTRKVNNYKFWEDEEERLTDVYGE